MLTFLLANISKSYTVYLEHKFLCYKYVIAFSVVCNKTMKLTSAIPEADMNILFYVAGRFSRSLCQLTNCSSCKELLLASKDDKENHPSFDDDYDQKMEYINHVNRGVGAKPVRAGAAVITHFPRNVDLKYLKNNYLECQ